MDAPPHVYIPGLFPASFGFIMTGDVLVWTLLGVLTIQIAHYLQRFPQDPLWMKIIVFSNWAIDFIRGGLQGYSLYSAFLGNFGSLPSLSSLDKTSWVLPALTVLGGLTAFITQTWFVRRLWLLNQKQWILPLATEIIAIVAFAGACKTAQVLRHASPLAMWSGNVSRYAGLWLTATFVVDVLVTSATAWNLRQQPLAFRQTKLAIDRVIVWIVATGALTASVTFVTVILFFTNNRGSLFEALVILSGTLYANAFLAFLIRRGTWDTKITQSESYGGISFGMMSGVTASADQKPTGKRSWRTFGRRRAPLLPEVRVETTGMSVPETTETASTKSGLPRTVGRRSEEEQRDLADILKGQPTFPPPSSSSPAPNLKRVTTVRKLPSLPEANEGFSEKHDIEKNTVTTQTAGADVVEVSMPSRSDPSTPSSSSSTP